MILSSPDVSRPVVTFERADINAPQGLDALPLWAYREVRRIPSRRDTRPKDRNGFPWLSMSARRPTPIFTREKRYHCKPDQRRAHRESQKQGQSNRQHSPNAPIKTPLHRCRRIEMRAIQAPVSAKASGTLVILLTVVLLLVRAWTIRQPAPFGVMRLPTPRMLWWSRRESWKGACPEAP